MMADTCHDMQQAGGTIQHLVWHPITLHARRRSVLAAPLVLLPLLGSNGSPAQAADPGKVLESLTPMDALRDKDYGKPRLK